MAKVLKILGVVWLVLAFSLIVVGSIGVFVGKGLWSFLWLFSPLNVANFLVVVLTLAPGGFLLWLSNRVESSK